MNRKGAFAQRSEGKNAKEERRRKKIGNLILGEEYLIFVKVACTLRLQTTYSSISLFPVPCSLFPASYDKFITQTGFLYD